MLEGLEDYVNYCDASKFSLGYVLMQWGKVIAYAFRQLMLHEKNYPTHGIELASLVYAPMVWRHYLYSVHIDVLKYHLIMNPNLS